MQVDSSRSFFPAILYLINLSYQLFFIGLGWSMEVCRQSKGVFFFRYETQALSATGLFGPSFMGW